jgi:SAM-dependent methyltransferase
MRAELLDLLACPACRGSLRLNAEADERGEFAEGRLACEGCDAEYPLVRGVPRMNWSMEGLEDIARTFGYEWKAHHRGELEDETLFGRTLDEDWRYFLGATDLGDEDVSRAAVLDGGCGSGRLTRQIGERGAGTVVGVDVNEAVDEAYAATRELTNVHIVQGNIFALPLKERSFDIVWSNGVIHHTPDAARGHASLSRMVKPGGTLYVWVYAKRFNPFRFVKDVLDALRVTRLPEPALMRISKTFAILSLGLLAAYRLVRRLPALRPQTTWGKRTVRPRTRHELELTWFDALSPEHDSRHTEEEVVGWFRSQGFERIAALEEPKVGVRGVSPDNA